MVANRPGERGEPLRTDNQAIRDSRGARVSAAAVGKMVSALEAGGVDFIAENGGGPGVRLKKPSVVSSVWLRAAQPRSLAMHGQIFLLSTNPPWVVLYTTWNAAFCYGAGFAWSFRLILVTPLIVAALLNEPNAWLGARTYSLVLNASFAWGERDSRIFTPGQSFVTKPEGEPSTNQAWRMAWGVVNVVAVYWWMQNM